jgi:hypothetical protein
MSLFSRRNRKKVTYAAGFFLFLVALFWFMLSGLFESRAPVMVTPTPTSTYLPIVQEQAVALPHPLPGGATGVDVVVQLRNPNAQAGVTNYPVEIRILSPDGTQLLTHTQTTYILPGSLQYVVALELRLEPGQSLGSLEISLPENPEFLELPNNVALPTFNTFLRPRTTRQIGSQVTEVQSGLIRNTSTFSWQRVEIAVIALDSSRSIVAAGKTVLGALAANEQREFTVEWPQTQAAISQVIALPTTDIFRDDNFLRVIGNPEGLR